VQLLVEALERALTLGRVADAERIVRRATAQVEELVASGGSIDAAALSALAVQAAATTLATNDPTWALWVLDVYRRTDRLPTVVVLESLREVATKHSAIMRGAVETLIEHLAHTARTASHDSVESLTHLEQMRRSLEELTRDPTEITGEWPGPS
jgi:hypothetical protein